MTGSSAERRGDRPRSHLHHRAVHPLVEGEAIVRAGTAQPRARRTRRAFTTLAARPVFAGTPLRGLLGPAGIGFVIVSADMDGAGARFTTAGAE